MVTYKNLCFLLFTDSGFQPQWTHGCPSGAGMPPGPPQGLYCSPLFLGHCSLMHLHVFVLHAYQLSAQMLSLYSILC